MKNTLFFIFTFIFTIYISAQKCDEAFSAANYSVAHTNKAYESNNAVHVREWTEKAMETFTEVEEITAQCGCTQVSELAYQGFEACDKAQTEANYERSRFFAKRAREKAKLMIAALSKCTNISVLDIEGRRDAGLNLSSDSGASDDGDYENDLNAQQNELLERQNELLEQQRIIQQQIAEQQKQVTALKQQRASELVQQKRIKVNAEIALAEIQKNHEKLATSIGCNNALNVTRISFTRGLDALEKESLVDTKTYYTNKLSEIVEKFNQSFADCANDW